ncbi:MAG TPA: 1,4-alpha-glucan branching protein domain-containing protein [Candidatus Acidoferrum sp.]|nr:1,4-alpha-glucan branching protein domain-containing protein [Candidatus Acidoferrum sp.]
MPGYLALVLHAHLPFVRHPEHERFLAESWLFEAITESYLPLLDVLQGWRRDGLDARLTLTLSPTLCSMLQDPLLQRRYERYLDQLLELAGKEEQRTSLEPAFHRLAVFYRDRLSAARQAYEACGRDLVGAFRQLQEAGLLEIVTTAATHAVLPLLAGHSPSLRGQVLVARDHYRACFGREPRGLWLPECAYAGAVDNALQEAGIRWFITEAHGLLHAEPEPRYATYAPIITPAGIVAFGRDAETARQVWSREEGYPGDARYRDFYRDVGFDLDYDYIKPYLPAPGQRGFTGLKYYRITSRSPEKQPYDRASALRATEEHARQFLAARVAQVRSVAGLLDRPPLVVAPYDAELFGHWWYEGPEFLDAVVRTACRDYQDLRLITPGEYLRRHPTNQVATPSPSSWGEEGYWRVWLNEKTEWIYPHLGVAQDRMTELARRFSEPAPLQERLLRQAARELLLAQASDWPFILRTGTSPAYARQRVKDHLLRFTRIYDQLMSGHTDEPWLKEVEERDNLFPEVNAAYWR